MKAQLTAVTEHSGQQETHNGFWTEGQEETDANRKETVYEKFQD